MAETIRKTAGRNFKQSDCDLARRQDGGNSYW
jgi:hypothetical protein